LPLRNTFTLVIFLVFSLCGLRVFSQVKGVDPRRDTTRNNFGLREKQRLGIRQPYNSFAPLPDNMKREVEYDAVNKRYIIRERVGGRILGPPQYLTIEQYQRLVNSEIKRNNWREISNAEAEEMRETGVIPSLTIENKSFQRLFGGNQINIQPRGEAELTFLGRINKNENPLFNERQRVQSNFDFNQRIQMDVVGNIGTKLKLNMNYNTECP
jgi:cell surface protein SprA